MAKASITVAGTLDEFDVAAFRAALAAQYPNATFITISVAAGSVRVDVVIGMPSTAQTAQVAAELADVAAVEAWVPSDVVVEQVTDVVATTAILPLSPPPSPPDSPPEFAANAPPPPSPPDDGPNVALVLLIVIGSLLLLLAVGALIMWMYKRTHQPRSQTAPTAPESIELGLPRRMSQAERAGRAPPPKVRVLTGTELANLRDIGGRR